MHAIHAPEDSSRSRLHRQSHTAARSPAMHPVDVAERFTNQTESSCRLTTQRSNRQLAGGQDSRQFPAPARADRNEGVFPREISCRDEHAGTQHLRKDRDASQPRMNQRAHTAHVDFAPRDRDLSLQGRANTIEDIPLHGQMNRETSAVRGSRERSAPPCARMKTSRQNDREASVSRRAHADAHCHVHPVQHRNQNDIEDADKEMQKALACGGEYSHAAVRGLSPHRWRAQPPNPVAPRNLQGFEKQQQWVQHLDAVRQKEQERQRMLRQRAGTVELANATSNQRFNVHARQGNTRQGQSAVRMPVPGAVSSDASALYLHQ
jgi:hypothetical protein